MITEPINTDAIAEGTVIILVWKPLTQVWAPAAIPDPRHGGPYLVTSCHRLKSTPATSKSGQKATRARCRVTVQRVVSFDPLTVDTDEEFPVEFGLDAVVLRAIT
jgi:hypothetical protein